MTVPLNEEFTSPVGQLLNWEYARGAYLFEVLRDQPVSFWRLSETTGTTAFDEISAANNGTFTAGFTLGQTGLLTSAGGTSISLNGSTGYVPVAHNSTLNVGDVFTIEAWIKRSVIGTAQVLADKGASAYRFGIDATNALYIGTGASVIASGGTLTDTISAHHVAVTKNGSTVKLYYDGVDITGAVSNLTLIDNSSALALGATSGGGASFFNGLIQEAALYNTALSTARILAHYQAGAGTLTLPITEALPVRQHINLREMYTSTALLPYSMADMRFWNVNHFAGQTMAQLKTSVQTQTGETWTSSPNVHSIAKDATRRYRQVLSAPLTTGSTVTLTSAETNDISLGVLPGTAYIDTILADFPSQLNIAHLDLNNSFIDFTSDTNFAAGQTDSIAFNTSLTDISGWAVPATVALTVSGNEITDATRTTNTQGDGRAVPDSSFGIWEGTTNKENTAGADVSFEAGTAGYTTGGTNTIASDAGQAKFGTKSCKATYQNNATLLDAALTLTAAAHSLSRWLYIPAAYDGGGVSVQFANFVGATGTQITAANMALRDQWQRVTVPNVVIAGGDLIGNVQVINTGAAPTAGRFIYIDGCQTEAKVCCTPFTIAPRSQARVQASATLLSETQAWVAVRMRLGWDTSAISSFPSLFTWETADAQNYFSLGRSSSVPTQWFFSLNRNNVGTVRLFADGSLTAGTVVTVICKWTNTTTGLSANGAAFSTGGRATAAGGTALPANFDIGARTVGGPDLANSDILWFACGVGTLTDADAATINGFGNTDPTKAAFPVASQPTMIWAADTANSSQIATTTADAVMRINRSSLVNANTAALKNVRLRLTPATPAVPSTPTATVTGVAGNPSGTYQYVVTYVGAGGETLASVASNTVVPASFQVTVTIPTGPSGTVSRNVYRDSTGTGTFPGTPDPRAGGADGIPANADDPKPGAPGDGVFHRLTAGTTVADNTTTSFTDNVSDAAIVSNPLLPASNTAGNFTYKMEEMRVVSSTWTPDVIDIDTKRDQLGRSLPQLGSPEWRLDYPPVFLRSDATARHLNQAIRFNSGTLPTAPNANSFRFIFRHDPATGRFASVRLASNASGTTITIYDNGVVQTKTTLSALTANTDYILRVSVKGINVTATIMTIKGIFYGTAFGSVVSGNANTRRGYIGLHMQPYYYDFVANFIKNESLQLAQFESSVFNSVKPVVGVTLNAKASTFRDLAASTVWSSVSGDGASSAVTSYGIPDLIYSVTPPTTYKVVRTGLTWYGGRESTDYLSLGDSSQVKLVGDIYPISQVRGTYRLVLSDLNGSIAFIAPITGLRANRWNHFEQLLNLNTIPEAYKLSIQQTGAYADSFVVDNLMALTTTMYWEASADGGTTWQPFLDAIGSKYTAIHFGTRGTQLKLRGAALHDSAWVAGYELIPFYAYPGH